MNPNDLAKTKVGQMPVNRERIAAAARSVAGLPDPQRQPLPARTLEQTAPPRHSSQRGVGVVVTITSFRRGRLLDDDNLIAGAKPLRDAIAAGLGIDDADKRIKFECRQQQTAGAEGTLVTISRV